jgi:acetyltransferase-like isoleucine patch superfamily enzyme
MHCKIIDSNFHPLEGKRQRHLTGHGVVIEEDVCLEPYCIIVDCVVERGTTVAPRTVVTRRVPANVLISGAPTRMTPLRRSA